MLQEMMCETRSHHTRAVACRTGRVRLAYGSALSVQSVHDEVGGESGLLLVHHQLVVV